MNDSNINDTSNVFNVIKRNNDSEQYSIEKIRHGIIQAFKSVSVSYNDDILDSIINKLNIYNNIKSSDIRQQIEISLMETGYYNVAKSFILYGNTKIVENRSTTEKIKFIKKYCKAINAASGSKYDPNANVNNRNIATMSGELPKKDLINVNRMLLYSKIKSLFGKKTANEYLDLLKTHFIYCHDETSINPYCASITMYPWLLNGTTQIGGNSLPPTNLKSFCGGFINMVFIVASMLSGACATPEFLLYLNYFLQKEYGDDYYLYPNKIVDLSLRQRTLDKVITDCFEQIYYSLNQPTGARNFQAIFWNISYYDKYYFKSLFEHFSFPDGKLPHWDSLNWLQKRAMKWFNQERLRTILTFPVETMALLSEGDDIKDKEYADFTAEMYAEGHSFFTYISESADSLSSCCRLKNTIINNEFSYSLGAGGVSTGSKNVITINLNRLIQYSKKANINYINYLKHILDVVHKAQIAYDSNLTDLQNSGMLPLYDAGYIAKNRQYLTIGINGAVEAAEFIGLDINDNPKYLNFIQTILGIIKSYNIEYGKKYNILFNTEFVPAESLGVKHAKWDAEDGYIVPRKCYNSYFYKVEDDSISILDKFKMHGRQYIENLTGGSALHINLDEHLSKTQYRKLLRIAAKDGCNYFTFNVPNTICNKCGHISKHRLAKCDKCGSTDLDYATRIIGYLVKVSKYSEGRKEEESLRHYHKKTVDDLSIHTTNPNNTYENEWKSIID